MKVVIREALKEDKSTVVGYAMELSRFNRAHHEENCKYDNFDKVLEAIKGNAERSFDERDENAYILVALIDEKPVGYALGRIFEQDGNADNGTGRMGLFDELYLDDSARGHGVGKKLMDGIMDWFIKKDIHRVKLHAYSWNTNARKIYEAQGFKDYVVSYERFL